MCDFIANGDFMVLFGVFRVSFGDFMIVGDSIVWFGDFMSSIGSCLVILYCWLVVRK